MNTVVGAGTYDVHAKNGSFTRGELHGTASVLSAETDRERSSAER
jgi:hypothetical protein